MLIPQEYRDALERVDPSFDAYLEAVYAMTRSLQIRDETKATQLELPADTLRRSLVQNIRTEQLSERKLWSGGPIPKVTHSDGYLDSRHRRLEDT
ncbi:hypothetical protein PG994_002883 [Apiospora phragmitis]|uniref:Uncharacterized protein n=1 Tax=Apiospora phragmitis TaxID=2905665 RepID=A0ABR1W6H1_9PEZI